MRSRQMCSLILSAVFGVSYSARLSEMPLHAFLLAQAPPQPTAAVAVRWPVRRACCLFIGVYFMSTSWSVQF